MPAAHSRGHFADSNAPPVGRRQTNTQDRRPAFGYKLRETCRRETDVRMHDEIRLDR